jgi:mannose-1-phosphate guanylyltransferase/phosphomannomutase
MILAAGYGSRLRPMTDNLPKPLVPIMNRPLLEYIIARVRAAGIQAIAMNLHYRGEQIRAWLGDGARHDVAVTYSEEPEILGSAGGIRRVRAFFGNEPALVIHGDLLFDVDLRAVIQYHLSHNAHATLVLHPAHHRYRYGMIKVNPQGEIGQFVDHHAPWIVGPFIDTVFTGVQVLDPVVLDIVAAERVAVLTTDVYPQLLSRSWRFYGYVMRGYWSDIGTPLRYWEANLDMLHGLVTPLDLRRETDALWTRPQPTERPTNHLIRPPVLAHPTVSVGSGVDIGPDVIVGEACDIAEGAQLRRSILWPRVQIGQGAFVDGSIITHDVSVPPGSHLAGKIVSQSGMADL